MNKKRRLNDEEIEYWIKRDKRLHISLDQKGKMIMSRNYIEISQMPKMTGLSIDDCTLLCATRCGEKHDFGGVAIFTTDSEEVISMAEMPVAKAYDVLKESDLVDNEKLRKGIEKYQKFNKQFQQHLESQKAEAEAKKRRRNKKKPKDMTDKKLNEAIVDAEDKQATEYFEKNELNESVTKHIDKTIKVAGEISEHEITVTFKRTWSGFYKATRIQNRPDFIKREGKKPAIVRSPSGKLKVWCNGRKMDDDPMTLKINGFFMSFTPKGRHPYLDERKEVLYVSDAVFPKENLKV